MKKRKRLELLRLKILVERRVVVMHGTLKRLSPVYAP